MSVSSKNIKFDEWFRSFVEQLTLSNADVSDTLIYACAQTASEVAEYDPFLSDEVASSASPPRKRRLSEDKKGDDAHDLALTNPYLDNPSENPQAFVDWQVKHRRWKRVVATSIRANSERYKDAPPRTYTYEFIVDGFEKTTFDYKDVIKAAGYTHFNKVDKAGWKPFQLSSDGRVNGFGREVQNPADAGEA